MAWESCKQNGKRGLKASMILRESFYIFTLALLSLLLPLSFLLLARLSRFKYFLTIIPNTAQPVSYILSLFLHTNPTILHLLVSFVSMTALVHVMTGRVPILNSESTSPIIRPRLYTAWIMLCTLQVCVGLGIEGTIADGVWSGEYDGGRVISLSLLSRVLFFVGLHETMAHWSRVFVRPVVDDTIFGSATDERWVERAVIGASYGGLWWWRLREEAEGLLLTLDVKGEFSIGTRIADNLSWCLYYLTVTIAAARLAKGLVWLVKAVCCCSRRKASYDNGGCSSENTDECKV